MHHLEGRSGDSMSKILDLLNKWGDDGIIVMSEKSLANLLSESGSGSLRTFSGERIEVKRFDSAMLKQMAAEDNSHLLSRIENWMDTGRLAGAGLNGHIAFRENIATMLGPEVTITIKNFHKTDPNADKSVPQQKVIQGRVESISEEEYDSVRKNVEALKQSLIPVETGQVDFQPSKKQEIAALREAPGLGIGSTEGKAKPSRGEHKKVEKKGKNAAHQASEATHQQEANKKRREEEKKRVRQEKVKAQRAEENLDYLIKDEQTEKQKNNQEKTKH